ncbi:MAG: transcription termination factor NusA [Bdellovibrionota bacterium]
MNLGDLEKVLDQVGKDKGIDKALLIGAVEEALLTVARRQYGAKKEIEAKYNPDLGEVELYEFKTVVETINDKDREISFAEAKGFDSEVVLGDSIGIKMDAGYLSRIAAQTAKQVLLQKVRDAERELIFNEFQHRKGEVITGLIRRVDKGAVIVDLGRTEGYMPLKEQIPEEPYNSGERIQAYLMDVQLTPKGPRIILSRACPEYLISLFENEVPEIREGLVEIVGASREPGIRAKVAVKSKDPQVDPVGACVGVRGSRVQNIIQELKGERIDIVPWDEEITRFVCNALSPAEIQKVVIDDQEKAIQVVVADENLSIAIGKRGQNVRLASQLTKWRLDIVSESEMSKRLAEAKYQLGLVPGITETMAMALYQNGVERVSDVAEITAEDLATVPGFDEARAIEIIKNAKEVIASGKASAPMPEELLDYATRKKLNKGKGDDAKTEGGDGVSAIEAKLRAELAAAEEKNKGDNN